MKTRPCEADGNERLDMKQLGRRDFLKTVAAVGAVSLAEGTTNLIHAQTNAPAATVKPAEKLRGVNLGGWLVLEKWMTPTLYAGTEAEDEYTLCTVLGAKKAADRLQRHRESWITADDFRWLAKHGINCVRLPVGYGVLEENAPFITAPDTLAWAFRTAGQNGIRVVLDLHGVPGSQNGWDHSGRVGPIGWYKSQENLDHSLRIIEGLAEFCKTRENLAGIELVNEPRQEVPLEILQQYYHDAYHRVRQHIPAEQAAVVIHDGFRPMAWDDFMQAPDYDNVLLDTHLYQCFSDPERQRNFQTQLDVAASGRRNELDKIRQRHRCVVGEWSCSLPPRSTRGLKGVAVRRGHAGVRRRATGHLRNVRGIGSSGAIAPKQRSVEFPQMCGTRVASG